MKRLCFLAILLCAAGQSQAGVLFDGKSVGYQYLFTDISTVFWDGGNLTVGSGIELANLYEGATTGTLDISDTNILVDFNPPSGSIWTEAPFNGFRIYDSLNSLPSFTSVTIDSSTTNMVGFTSDRISLDADNIWVNWQGLEFGDDTVVSLDVNASVNPPVPEPTTLAIWSVLGGLGMIAARRRRRA